MAQENKDDLLGSGKALFQRHCGRCHGMLGAGGTGPSLQRSYLPRASTDEQLTNLISNGIPGTGMPSIWILTDPEIKQIASYVRAIGKESDQVISGNVENGKSLFKNSICSTCHIVSGEGGSLGPELTSIGSKRGAKYLAAALTHPGKNKPLNADGFLDFLVVSIKLKNEEMITGIRLNEDTFSIQIKDASNQIYSFQKSDIVSIEKVKDRSLMPSFTDQFSKDEMNDLVAYLNSLR
jgi:putative heme-binding domain-containing protein